MLGLPRRFRHVLLPIRDHTASTHVTNHYILQQQYILGGICGVSSPENDGISGWVDNHTAHGDFPLIQGQLGLDIAKKSHSIDENTERNSGVRRKKTDFRECSSHR
jgi:hypothetical protein